MFYAKDSTITFEWVIPPTASPLAKTAYDILLVTPIGVATYTDDGILTYIAPTATAQGKATYALTPTLTGRYQVSLMVGTTLAHAIKSERELYVVVPPDHVLNGVSGKTIHGPEIDPEVAS